MTDTLVAPSLYTGFDAQVDDTWTAIVKSKNQQAVRKPVTNYDVVVRKIESLYYEYGGDLLGRTLVTLARTIIFPIKQIINCSTDVPIVAFIEESGIEIIWDIGTTELGIVISSAQDESISLYFIDISNEGSYEEFPFSIELFKHFFFALDFK